jgi:hypothetical protein
MHSQEHMWDSQTGIRKLTQEVVDGAICKGCLKKQGANWKTWRTRYFILTEHVLYYLSSAKNPVPRGAILLSNTIIEGADETIDKPWCFLVKARKSYTGTIAWTNRTYYLQAADYADMNKWIQALLSNPVRLSQQISYLKLGEFTMIHDTASSRANSDASILHTDSVVSPTRHKPTTTPSTTSLVSNHDEKPPTRSPLFSTPDPTNESTDQDDHENLHLSECYTMETPSYMMQNYTTFSSSDESDCEEDTD